VVAVLAGVTIAVLLVGLTTSDSRVVTSTQNPGNDFAAKTSFANTLAYSAIGPLAWATNSTNVTVSYPSGSQPNDLLLLVEVNATNQNITTPSGWTLLADATTTSPNQFRFTIWWKLRGASDTSVVLNVKTNSSGATARVIRYVRPGGYPPNPITATASVAGGTNGVSTTYTPTPNITTNQPDATVISIVAVRDANTLSLSTPRSFTVRSATSQTSTGQSTALGVADVIVGASPATPASPTWSQTGTAAQWAWATIAFA
jgi:hypothetical protein